MKHHYTNSLAEVRANAEVSIKHLALLSSVNPTTLKDMESGKQRPSLKVIAMYHMLFKAPYKVLFADLCADVHTYLTERSENLSMMLKSSQSQKSKRTIHAITNIVNRLNKGYND